MRCVHTRRRSSATTPKATTLISTPLYSNTTLVSVLPTLAGGGRVVLMKKFDARRFLNSRKPSAPPMRCWCPCNMRG